MLLLRPMRQREPEKVSINVHLAKDIDTAVRKFAAANEQTLTWAVNKLLRKALGSRVKENGK